MKISLFTKSYTMKACSFILLTSLIASVPTEANASFFGDLMKSVIGSSVQADSSTSVSNSDNNSFGTDNFSNNSQNSQNIPLLESSVDPDMKNADNTSSVTIVGGQAISPDNGLIGIGLESVSNGEMTTYVVQEGDTLSEIAMQYDISVNTIKWENNITGNNIQVGQKLNILPVTGVKHIVKKGDTLSKIADKYDADVNDIMVFNDVTQSSNLNVGDILYVPNGIIKPTVSKPTKSSSTNGTSTSTSSSPSSATAGYYMKPVSGPITSPYGSRRGSFHSGVDIGVSRGTTVVAAATGVVVDTVNSCREGQTSCGGRYGNFIVIQHSNGTFTRYAHMSKVSVSVGESVNKGENIGATGNTGHTTGPHLHFQIEKANGSTIRPAF